MRRHDMNCEWVERHLSAYHDGVLDPATTELIRTHLVECADCSEILASYTRHDALLRAAPRVSPSPALRERLFASPEFQQIVRERANPSAPPIAPVSSIVRPTPQTARRVAWTSGVIASLLIAGLVIITNIAAKRPSGPAFTTCANTGVQVHLAFLSEDVLYRGDAKLVCDAHTPVGSLWSVSPDGQWIAYVNKNGGALRLVRSNGIGDHAVETGPGAIETFSWSPDGQKLAIVKQIKGDQHAMLITGVSDAKATTRVNFTAAATTHAPLWAPGGDFITWVTGDTLSFLATNEGDTQTLAQHVGSVGVFAGGVSYTIVTNGQITAIATAHFDPTTATVTQDAPIQVNGNMANFNPTTQRWAITSGDGAVSEVDVTTGASTALALIGPIAQMAWSPQGTSIAIVSNGTLWLVSAEGANKIATDLKSIAPTWNADGSAIAFVTQSGTRTFTLSTSETRVIVDNGAGNITGLSWSPDKHTLAVWGDEGIALATPAGASAGFIDRAITAAPQWISGP